MAMKLINRLILATVFVSFSSFLTGCKFGDGENGLEALAKKKRLLNYHCAITLPSLAPCDTALVDLGAEGLNVNWETFSAIAVMGNEFQIKKDTTGLAALPVPQVLSYNRYLSRNCELVDGFSVLAYDFSSYAKHSNGDAYATSVNFIYPYERLISSKGDTLKSCADSIPMDFHLQDGKLSTIQKKYYIAMGHARAICSNKDVVMVDSAYCQMNHDHFSNSEDRILLDTKIAVLRLSFIVPAQEDFSLIDYLRGLNISGYDYYIDQIQVSNQKEEASGFSRVQLNLRTGWMEPTPAANTFVTLNDANHFWNCQDIKRENGQSLVAIGGETSTWGTTLFVAVPCTEEGTLDIDPLITVSLKQGNPATTTRFYGKLEPITLKEGGYYLSSPIKLYRQMEKIDSPAQLYMTPTCR